MQELLNVFNWVVTASIMGSILAGVILLAKLILNKTLNAKLHYVIWFLLLIRLIIPYVPQSSLSIFNIVKPINILSIQNASESYSDKMSFSLNKRYQVNLKDKAIKKDLISDQKDDLKKYVSLNKSIDKNNNTNNNLYNNFILSTVFVWLFGVLIFLLYAAVSNNRFKIKIKHNSVSADQDIYAEINECKKILNINKEISVLITKEVHSPALLGIISPKLLIPYSLIGNISRQELRLIFFHELAHYKHKDNMVNWLIVILKGLHWFNPLIWYSFYRMRLDCELACDAAVLSHLGQKEQREYGYTILHLLKLISTYKNVPGAVGIMSSSSKISVKRRITMISNFKKTSIKSISLAAVLFAAIGLTGLTNAQKISPITRNSSPKALQQTVSVKIIPANYTEKNVTLKYPKISNLADINKQNTLNKIIKNDALKMLNYFKNISEGFTADIKYSVKLNNGKVLSIAYFGYVNYKNAAHPSNIFYTTNLNMNNGAKIKLTDLVNLNQALINKIRAAKYIGPLEQNSELNTAVKDTMSQYTNDMIIKMLKAGDMVKGEVFSYLTKDSLVISLPLMHVIGDYGEFAIKYRDITNDIKTKNVIWKDIVSK